MAGGPTAAGSLRGAVGFPTRLRRPAAASSGGLLDCRLPGRGRSCSVPFNDQSANAVGACAICDGPITEHALRDDDSGREYHAACAVGRLPEDAITGAMRLLALVVVPTILVWAS
jgi:hypothetical protein